jgi:tetratricopeptide (TPR) repeat protein
VKPAGRTARFDTGVIPVNSDREHEAEVEPIREAVAERNLGVGCLTRGDFAGAVAHFDRAVALAPDFAPGYRNRAAVRGAAADHAGALADCDTAVRLDPGSAAGFNVRATVRLALGDLAGARADCEEALRLDPAYAAAFSNRAAVRNAAGDFAGALADGTAALRIEPRLCAAHVARANARYHLLDSGSARDYAIAFAIDPDLAAAAVINILAGQAWGNAAAALADCERHLRRNPDDGPNYGRRGLIHMLRGEDPGRDRAELERCSPELKPFADRLFEEAKRKLATRPRARVASVKFQLRSHRRG